jgi:hypothetical protein
LLEQIKIYAFLGGIIALALLFVLIPIYINYPWGTYRYRVTVEIVTPEGIKIGSAVREIRVHTEPGFFGVRKQGIDRLIGEAVVIDLGTRGVVLALLSEDDLYQAFPYNNGKGVLSPMGIRYYKSLKLGMKAPLPPEKYPTFVTFKDLSDPKSLQLVYGQRFDVEAQKHLLVDEMETLFGAGVRIQGITIEITNDPLMWGTVDKFLPKTFNAVIRQGWGQLSYEEKKRLVNLTSFQARP